MGHKIYAQTSTSGRKAVSAEAAVDALAQHLGVTFKGYSDGDWVTAAGGRQNIIAPVYKDGAPEVFPDPHAPSGVWPSRAGFTETDGLLALAAALGLEFRAEYVVGAKEPQLKAVKKPKA